MLELFWISLTALINHVFICNRQLFFSFFRLATSWQILARNMYVSYPAGFFRGDLKWTLQSANTPSPSVSTRCYCCRCCCKDSQVTLHFPQSETYQQHKTKQEFIQMVPGWVNRHSAFIFSRVADRIMEWRRGLQGTNLNADDFVILQTLHYAINKYPMIMFKWGFCQFQPSDIRLVLRISISMLITRQYWH